MRRLTGGTDRSCREIKNNILFSLGEIVKNGGGTEILKLVEEAKAGRRLGSPAQISEESHD